MAFTISSFGSNFSGFSGSVDPASESLVSALEQTSFAPSPGLIGGSAFGAELGFGSSLGFGAPFGAPSYAVGANPIMQLLPMLLSSLSGLGQGWGSFVGSPSGGLGQTQFAPPQQQQGGGGCRH